MRFSLTRWRLLLLAAFVLLAGAMGGGDAVARAGIGPTATDCPDQGKCDQRLTAPAQPALIQAALRIDGKAVATGDGINAALPGPALPSFRYLSQAEKPAFTGRLPHKAGAGPGQPRGPPARA